MQQLWIKIRESTDTKLYLIAFALSVLGFGVIDPRHNPAQVLFVAGLMLVVFGGILIMIAIDCDSRISDELLFRVMRNLILPGAIIALGGVFLFVIGICEAPFWAK